MVVKIVRFVQNNNFTLSKFTLSGVEVSKGVISNEERNLSANVIAIRHLPEKTDPESTKAIFKQWGNSIGNKNPNHSGF